MLLFLRAGGGGSPKKSTRRVQGDSQWTSRHSCVSEGLDTFGPRESACPPPQGTAESNLEASLRRMTIWQRRHMQIILRGAHALKERNTRRSLFVSRSDTPQEASTRRGPARTCSVTAISAPATGQFKRRVRVWLTN